jgi:hypothetical protein
MADRVPSARCTTLFVTRRRRRGTDRSAGFVATANGPQVPTADRPPGAFAWRTARVHRHALSGLQWPRLIKRRRRLVDAAQRHALPAGRDPVATEAVRALERHVAAACPLLDAYEEVEVVGVARLDPQRGLHGPDQFEVLGQRPTPACPPRSDREPDPAGIRRRSEAKPVSCQVELGPLDLRRRPGLGRAESLRRSTWSTTRDLGGGRIQPTQGARPADCRHWTGGGHCCELQRRGRLRGGPPS